jgi:hypothetical protein
MAPTDDVERPRASSGAERQKSIVSMTEFEGMDEFTALQKYILFYRDTRTNPHAEKTVKKKAWWQFWKSGSATAAAPIEDTGLVPDERKYSLPSPLRCTAALHHGASAAQRRSLLCSSGGCAMASKLKLLALELPAALEFAAAVRSQSGPPAPPPNCSPPCSMRDEHRNPSEQSR